VLRTFARLLSLICHAPVPSCSELWCVAVCHTAPHCNTTQHTAIHRNSPQLTATSCWSSTPHESQTCGSELQCIAVHCGALQCVAVCCSVLQRVAMCCSVLQYVAACCSALQCVATRLSVFFADDSEERLKETPQCLIVCCSALQCVAAVCCSKLHYVAACCSVLQRTSQCLSQTTQR